MARWGLTRARVVRGRERDEVSRCAAAGSPIDVHGRQWSQGGAADAGEPMVRAASRRCIALHAMAVLLLPLMLMLMLLQATSLRLVLLPHAQRM